MANSDLYKTPTYCKAYYIPDEDNVTYIEDNPLTKIEVSDPAKILQLCENLTDIRTKNLEGKLNIYVSKKLKENFDVVL